MSKLIIKCDRAKANSLDAQLAKLRAFVTGWTEAGKLPPPGSEAIWQVQQLLRDAKESDK
jgi:hypothetical protein